MDNATASETSIVTVRQKETITLPTAPDKTARMSRGFDQLPREVQELVRTALIANMEYEDEFLDIKPDNLPEQALVQSLAAANSLKTKFNTFLPQFQLEYAAYSDQPQVVKAIEFKHELNLFVSLALSVQQKRKLEERQRNQLASQDPAKATQKTRTTANTDKKKDELNLFVCSTLSFQQERELEERPRNQLASQDPAKSIKKTRVTANTDKMIEELARMPNQMKIYSDSHPSNDHELLVMSERVAAAKTTVDALISDGLKLLDDTTNAGLADQAESINESVTALRSETFNATQMLTDNKSALGILSTNVSNVRSDLSPPKFSGTGEPDFFTFKQDWNKYIASKPMSKAERFQVLTKTCLSGQAQNISIRFKTVPEVFKQLQKTYGNARLLFENKIDAVKQKYRTENLAPSLQWEVLSNHMDHAVEDLTFEVNHNLNIGTGNVISAASAKAETTKLNEHNKSEKQNKRITAVVPAKTYAMAATAAPTVATTAIATVATASTASNQKKVKAKPQDKTVISTAYTTPSDIECCHCGINHSHAFYCKVLQTDLDKERISIAAKLKCCFSCSCTDAQQDPQATTKEARDEWYTKHEVHCKTEWKCEQGKCQVTTIRHVLPDVEHYSSKRIVKLPLGGEGEEVGLDVNQEQHQAGPANPALSCVITGLDTQRRGPDRPDLELSLASKAKKEVLSNNKLHEDYDEEAVVLDVNQEQHRAGPANPYSYCAITGLDTLTRGPDSPDPELTLASEAMTWVKWMMSMTEGIGAKLKMCEDDIFLSTPNEEDTYQDLYWLYKDEYQEVDDVCQQEHYNLHNSYKEFIIPPGRSAGGSVYSLRDVTNRYLDSDLSGSDAQSCIVGVPEPRQEGLQEDQKSPGLHLHYPQGHRPQCNSRIKHCIKGIYYHVPCYVKISSGHAVSVIKLHIVKESSQNTKCASSHANIYLLAGSVKYGA